MLKEQVFCKLSNVAPEQDSFEAHDVIQLSTLLPWIILILLTPINADSGTLLNELSFELTVFKNSLYVSLYWANKLLNLLLSISNCEDIIYNYWENNYVIWNIYYNN